MKTELDFQIALEKAKKEMEQHFKDKMLEVSKNIEKVAESFGYTDREDGSSSGYETYDALMQVSYALQKAFEEKKNK